MLTPSPIGPRLIDADYDPDIDLEEHGTFTFFNNNPGYGEHYLRLCVWREAIDYDDLEATPNIIGHDFDYFHFDGSSAESVDTADTAIEAVAFLSRRDQPRAMIAAQAFERDDYPRLIAGEIALDEVRDTPAQSQAIFGSMSANLTASPAA